MQKQGPSQCSRKQIPYNLRQINICLRIGLVIHRHPVLASLHFQTCGGLCLRGKSNEAGLLVNFRETVKKTLLFHTLFHKNSTSFPSLNECVYHFTVLHLGIQSLLEVKIGYRKPQNRFAARRLGKEPLSRLPWLPNVALPFASFLFINHLFRRRLT